MHLLKVLRLVQVLNTKKISRKKSAGEYVVKKQHIKIIEKPFNSKLFKHLIDTKPYTNKSRSLPGVSLLCLPYTASECTAYFLLNAALVQSKALNSSTRKDLEKVA